jgi:hypothetical protein
MVTREVTIIKTKAVEDTVVDAVEVEIVETVNAITTTLEIGLKNP